jgi:hypothetical protein
VAKTKQTNGKVTMDRRDNTDRRHKPDRRTKGEPVAVERRETARRKVARRRQIDPTTCERDYTGDEIEFMQALDDYKRRSGRMFPTCSEILEVVRDLGYAKTAAQAEAAPVEISAASMTAAEDTPTADDDAAPASDTK